MIFLKATTHPFIIGYVEHILCVDAHNVPRNCIVLELADGGSLKSNIVKKQIPEETALTWFTQCCLALAYMHRDSYLNRDVKPENILLAGGTAKLCDFGSIKDEGLFGGTHTIVVGSKRYMAPEQLTGKYCFKIDVWAAGIALYEMCTGGDHPMNFDFSTLDHTKYNPAEIEFKPMPEFISKPI